MSISNLNRSGKSRFSLTALRKMEPSCTAPTKMGTPARYAVANSVGLAVMELLKHAAGFNVTAVPYRSMPQAVTDLIAGRVSILVVRSNLLTPC